MSAIHICQQWRIAVVITATVAALASRADDMVLRWNQVLHTTVRIDNTSPGPTWASRNSALVHLAIFEAVNSIQRTYQPFYEYVPASPAASIDAAAAQAAYRMLIHLYPAQKSVLEINRASSLASIPATERTAGVAVGNAAADLIIARRTNDGSDNNTPYVPKSDPGKWRPDPLHPTQTALGANWGRVTPFALDSAGQFRAPAPPALDSIEYAKSFDEVQRLGARTGSERTDDQTEIGVFWGYDRGGLGPPTILFDEIARGISLQRNFNLEENARLFAMLEVAQADAGIACWESKYLYEYWRPIGGIREAATDGNPDTTSISDWEPLGAPGGGPPRDFTPPFPAYPSGHATFGGAIFRILELICGSDDVTFTVVSEEVPAAPRIFSSFSKAAKENARSRIYLGVHWDFDDIQGRAMGRKVADHLFSSRFTPVLHAQPSKDHLDIAWPAGAKSYRVKYSADLRGGQWVSMDMAPVVSGSEQFVSVPMAEIGFYKLGMQVR